MSSTGKYIYGVINTGSHAAAPLLLGLNGVYTVPHGDVSAIVNDSEILDYANLPADAAAVAMTLLTPGVDVTAKVMQIESLIKSGG